MLSRKEKANRCAKTTQGIHMTGMEPPYAGSITSAAVALLLMMLVWWVLLLSCGWSAGVLLAAVSVQEEVSGSRSRLLKPLSQLLLFVGGQSLIATNW